MTTQKEIADQLGVSPSLVSRALSGTANEIGVSAKTIHRIRELAAKLNYRPSAAALTLRGASTRTLGVIVRNFEDPFFGHMIGELQALAWTKQYSLVLTGCPPGNDQAIDLASLVKYQLDGVIIVGSDFEPEGLDAFSLKGIPLVQIGAGRWRAGDCPGDDGPATRLATTCRLSHEIGTPRYWLYRRRYCSPSSTRGDRANAPQEPRPRHPAQRPGARGGTRCGNRI